MFPPDARLSLSVKIYTTGKRRPDGSNVFKSVEDGLEGVAYENDRQIVYGSFEVQEGEPRVEVEINEKEVVRNEVNKSS